MRRIQKHNLKYFKKYIPLVVSKRYKRTNQFMFQDTPFHCRSVFDNDLNMHLQYYVCKDSFMFAVSYISYNVKGLIRNQSCKFAIPFKSKLKNLLLTVRSETLGYSLKKQKL